MKINAVMIAFGLAFLSACSSMPRPAADLIGKWSAVSMNSTWEFCADGTVYVHGGDGSKTEGHYAWLGKDRIAFDFRAANMSAVESVVVTATQLSLTTDKGEKTVFVRSR